MSFSLVNIKKQSQNNWGLENINWEIKAGEYWALIGKSGAGKTTLAEIMCGLKSPDSGIILWNNVECKDPCKLWGFQFQNNALFNSYTGYENLIFPIKYSEYNFSEIFFCKIAVWYAYILGFDPRILGLYPNQMSGGQKKLISLARALVKNPPFLLLDEPTAGLDPITALKYDLLIDKICTEMNKGVVCITHDIQRIKKASHVAYLNHELQSLEIKDPRNFKLDWWSEQMGGAFIRK